MPCQDDILINLETTEENIVVNVTECSASVDLADGVLAGRGTGSGFGPLEEITVGTGLQLDGTTLNVTISGADSIGYRRHFFLMGA